MEGSPWTRCSVIPLGWQNLQASIELFTSATARIYGAENGGGP